MSDPTAVYRFFDHDGFLLYVGTTRNPAGRFTEHRRKTWWRLIDPDRITLSWFDGRGSALNSESLAIAAERPVFNVTGKGITPAQNDGIIRAYLDGVHKLLPTAEMGGYEP